LARLLTLLPHITPAPQPLSSRRPEALMRLVTFVNRDGQPEAGVLTDGHITGLGTQMLAVCASGNAEPTAGRASDAAGVKLLAPVPRPPKFICVGLNYRDHAAEARMEIPSVPTIFNKFTNVVIGPGEPIVLPKVSTKPDYEAEFAFVIGKGGRYIPASRAMEHVFGYTIVNDVSARDFQGASTQWLMGKSFDTFAPTGPWIVTRDEIADPHALDISLEIGGETLQKSNTRELIFKIPELVEYISQVVTLEPGDIVATGTPAGVGFARRPRRWLQPGEEVVIRIEGIGELRNPVVAESGH
jgi:acylpyruvate hydrolase